MTTQSAQQSAALELALLDVVRTLPSRRVLQVLDFARWLQNQRAPDEVAGNNAIQEEIKQARKL